MNNILQMAAPNMSLAIYAAQIAEDYKLDITKIYCRKTGKQIGYRTEEDVALLQQMFDLSELKPLAPYFNLADSISPAFIKIQTDTLNKLEEIAPYDMFVYFLNLLTRQFSQAFNMKNERIWQTVEQENKFKNSLILANQIARNMIDIEKIKECNNKIRWLLTLNLPAHRFYAIDITNALDYATITQKAQFRREVEWMTRDKFSKLPAYRFILSDAIKLAEKTNRIIEHTFYAKWAIENKIAQFEEDKEIKWRMFDTLSRTYFNNGDNVFYDPTTKLCYKNVDDIPVANSVGMRDFEANPILPHELATDRGVNWIVNYFPRAFEKCKSHIARNKMLGWHENKDINRIFTRGNKTDEISNEFAQYLKDVNMLVASKKTTRQHNENKRAVEAARRNVQPLDISSLETAIDAMSSGETSVKPTKSLTELLKKNDNTPMLTFTFKPMVK